MAHHAYFAVGERAQAIAGARAFADRVLDDASSTLETIVLSFELFSVEDARKLISIASTSGAGGNKVIIVSLARFFHESQNALLKILEEPPAGTTIILCVPSDGIFIPTLRSRLLPVPVQTNTKGETHAQNRESISARFLAANAAGRKKIVDSLLEQSKSDKDETKQQARRTAIELIQGLTEAAHAQFRAAKTPNAKNEARALLEDLSAFMPILYERSAPLKLIFEHLMLVLPKGLKQASV